MEIKAARKRLKEIIDRDAIIRKKVVLSSGKESDYYVDVRKVSLQAEGNFLIGRLMWELISKDPIAAVGGPTIGADPIIAAVLSHAYADKHPLNGFIIRTAQKKHGMMNVIEGPVLKAGASVILLDDVVTTGGSLKNAIALLEKEQIRIHRILAVLDRQEEKQFDPVAYQFTPLFKISDFI